MDLYKTTVAFGLLLLLMFGLLKAQSKPIHWKKGNPEVTKYTVITICLYIISYALVVIGNYTIIISGIPKNAILFAGVVYISFIIVLLWKQLKVIWSLLTFPVEKESLRPYVHIFCMIWFALFAMLASINYTIYTILPTWYEIQPESLTFLEIAFEFVYYTFSLMISYSSDSISVNCIGSKVVQIVECLFFYIVVGNLINQLINGATEVAKAPTSKADITEK